MFLAGHGSDMEGSKALAIEAMADRHKIPFLRFDYFGHGRSDGDFLEGNLSRWLADCTAMLDGLTKGPQILVGSSLGGWLMLLCALQRKSRVAGLVGIAAAPDFTRTLIWDALSPARQQQMKKMARLPCQTLCRRGCYLSLSPDRGRKKHQLLEAEIALDIPVILHQGMADEEVPIKQP